jgi:hypothetical protein
MKMELTKFKITTAKTPGYMMVVYQDKHLKSILNEFAPPLTEVQLNIILNRIPDDPAQLIPLFNEKYAGKIIVEPVKAIGAEPDGDYPANKKIAMFCEFYEAKTRVKYKVSMSDSGKISQLKAPAAEWEKLMQTYFNSRNFLFLNKYSISNIAKYWNELIVEAFGEPASNFPIPYDHTFFKTFDLMGQRAYWKALRDAGYTYQAANNREGKWVKKTDLNNQI